MIAHKPTLPARVLAWLMLAAGLLVLGVSAAPPSDLPPPDLAPSRFRRRSARLLAWLLIAVGVLALVDAGVTLLWEEPLSALYARIQQDRLSGALRTIEHAAPTPPQQRALTLLHAETERVAFLAGELQRHSRSGGAVGRIRIPRLNIDFVVVKGTSEDELRKGPGIYPETPFPGIAGTTAIAGHRTTYLAPFRHIDALREGDRILLKMPYGRFTYEVTGSRVVLPTNVSVIDPVGYSQLVLSACTPPFSASHRMVVFARLRSIEPLGAARPHDGPVQELRLPAGQPSKRLAPSPPRGLPQVLKPLERLPLSLIA
jgi:sortase A